MTPEGQALLLQTLQSTDRKLTSLEKLAQARTDPNHAPDRNRAWHTQGESSECRQAELDGKFPPRTPLQRSSGEKFSADQVAKLNAAGAVWRLPKSHT
jgi:hypothetical protein